MKLWKRFLELWRERDTYDYLEMHTERRQMNLKVAALLAGILWTGPTLTPAQGAEILRTAGGVANRTNVRTYEGARVVIFGGNVPTAGPWKFPAPAPPRRLDGTLLSDPVTVYGVPPFYHHVGRF